MHRCSSQRSGGWERIQRGDAWRGRDFSPSVRRKALRAISRTLKIRRQPLPATSRTPKTRRQPLPATSRTSKTRRHALRTSSGPLPSIVRLYRRSSLTLMLEIIPGSPPIPSSPHAHAPILKYPPTPPPLSPIPRRSITRSAKAARSETASARRVYIKPQPKRAAPP